MIENGIHILMENLLGTDYATLNWQKFHEGVTIFPLYKSTTSKASAALLRYVPGASVPSHLHTGYEHLLILEGSQEDERGLYKQGDFVINKPNTTQWVKSVEGCVLLAIWEAPVEFV